MTRGLLSCGICCLLFSQLDEAGRCASCADRHRRILQGKKPVDPSAKTVICRECGETCTKQDMPDQMRISAAMRGYCTECVESIRRDRQIERQRAREEGLTLAQMYRRKKAGPIYKNETGKVCTECNTFKLHEEFYAYPDARERKTTHGGWRTYSKCKICVRRRVSAAAASRRKRETPVKPPSVVTDEGRECSRCRTFKPWHEYYKGIGPNKRQSQCRACLRGHQPVQIRKRKDGTRA